MLLGNVGLQNNYLSDFLCVGVCKNFNFNIEPRHSRVNHHFARCGGAIGCTRRLALLPRLSVQFVNLVPVVEVITENR